MKKFALYTMALAMAVAGTSCSNDEEPAGVPQGDQLNVSRVGLASIAKSGITATSFTNGETLGLFIYRGTGIEDGSKDYNSSTSTIPTVNVPYKQGAGGWTATQPIFLSNVKGRVYSYYPYNASNNTNDGKTIPVTVNASQGTGQSDGTKDTAEQTDYMYSDVVSDISNANPSTALTMNHALAMVSFKFKQTDDATQKYPGEGKVSEIVLKNKDTKQNFKTGAGTMHIGTGAINTATASAGSITLAPDASETLMDVTDADKLPRMLVYPMAVAEGDLQITVTVDGNSYTLDVNAIADGYKAGNNYEYTFTLKGTKLEITNVSIKEWITQEQTGGDIQTPDRP
ncbi:fimbrillin family protein [Parabacteroides merdae]|uniref:fimbrillin family protein n=1 Tax=Parabacteroides merdae TaxID=46503 RepID=UPI0034A113A4